jgi:hypothetical protein
MDAMCVHAVATAARNSRATQMQTKYRYHARWAAARNWQAPMLLNQFESSTPGGSVSGHAPSDRYNRWLFSDQYGPIIGWIRPQGVGPADTHRCWLDAAHDATIHYRASLGAGIAFPMRWMGFRVRLPAGLLAALLTIGLLGSGCAAPGRAVEPNCDQRPRVIVVSPVLNLSGAADLDSLKLTDIVASEFLSFPSVSVVPVNLTLAALDRRGKAWVETPEDALELAREFGADATVVTAVTEYNPYDPPIVGLVMQWYEVPHADAPHQGASADVALLAATTAGPQLQVQRVFDASHNGVQDEMRTFAAARPGHESPYGWHRWAEAQELYLRFCCWSTIKQTMQSLPKAGFSATAPGKVES